MKHLFLSTLLFLTVSTSAAVAEAPALSFYGQIRQGEMLFGHVTPGSKITVNDEPITPRKDGWFAVGIGRNDTGDLVFKAEKDGELNIQTYPIKPRQWRVQHVNGLPQNTVTPTPEEEKRIAEEMVMAWEARQKSVDMEMSLC